jgi:3-hydroxyisobutyrate dehydrogenase-like beta-hydroxyacid dehydrogenase
MKRTLQLLIALLLAPLAALHAAEPVSLSADHAAKDSGIAAGLAIEVVLNLPLNAATVAQYTRMVELGLGGLDKSGIAELTFKGRHA